MKEIIAVGNADRWKYRELLLLADPEEAAVNRYLHASDMYVLRVGGKDVCEAVVRGAAGEECELMNLATCEEEQGRGYASDLVRWLMARYSERYRTMLVGTSEDGRAFYRRLGFSDAFVREGFFLDNYEEPIFENGKQCADMYCLRAELRR